MNNTKGYTNWILDLDDTLVHCAVYYHEKQKQFIEYQTQRTGLPESFVGNLRNQMDLVFTQMHDGFNRNRFPRSFKAGSIALDVIQGNDIDHEAAEQSFRIGDSVFSAPYEPFQDSIPFLEYLRGTGCNLFLLTKGDDGVQRNKIVKHAIDRYIPWSNIYIVPKKTGECIHMIASDHKLDYEQTIMVGDSIRDDIGAAINANVDSVHINRADKTSWAYENAAHSPTYIAQSLDELKQYVRSKELCPVA